MTRRPAAVLMGFLLFASLAEPTELAAQTRDRSALESIVDSVAAGVLAMAWPTAAYKSSEFVGFRDDGRIVFKIHAISGWDQSDLWLEVIYSTDNGSVEWGRHNGFWPPGSAVAIMAEVLKEEPTSTTPNTFSSQDVVLTWTIADKCADRSGVQVRFHDTANKRAWPDFNNVYVIGPGQTRTFRLSAKSGTPICFGAQPDQRRPKTYWGIDVFGDKGCTSCCYSAGTFEVSRELTCD